MLVVSWCGDAAAMAKGAWARGITYPACQHDHDHDAGRGRRSIATGTGRCPSEYRALARVYHRAEWGNFARHTGVLSTMLVRRRRIMVWKWGKKRFSFESYEKLLK